MPQNLPNQRALTGNFAGVGPVTRAMVQARTQELALMAGRLSWQVTQADYEQAKRELTGESDRDRQNALLDALPEFERWDPVSGSAGRPILESPSGDEDDEVRSEMELLVEEGAGEAERDRILQAARATKKSK